MGQTWLRSATELRNKPLCRPTLGLALLVSLSACTGGSGGSGGAVTLATGDQGDDPVVLEIPIAYIKRSLPTEPTDLRDPLAFNPGATLLVRDRASATADEIDISQQIAEIVAEEEAVAADQILLDIKDLESAYDGATLIFAVRAVPQPAAINLENTTWNLWTYDIESNQAQYLIPSRLKRNEGVETGGGHDIAPHYLPDDRIVFSSTRQVASQARQLNEGRNQIFAALDEDRDDPAAVLHIYDPLNRNAEFKQISYNLSHDLDPTVLASGEIVFSRWNNTATNHISLYRIAPDGSALSQLYGFDSQNSGTEGAAIEYTQPRELDDGRLVSLIKSFSSATFGGDIVITDSAAYASNEQPVWANQGASGQGQESLTETEIRTDGLLSTGGQFTSVYPLRDGTGRLLVSWSACRVVDPEANVADGEMANPGDYVPCTLQEDNETAAPPVYGGWIFSPQDNTQQPVVLAEEGFMITELIAAEPRDFPDLVARADNFDGSLALQGQGKLEIGSVYDLDGADGSPLGIEQHAQPGTPAHANRPARFLRIVQPVPIPDRDVFEIPRYAFGVSTAFSFREIAGYVPVEPDGSVGVTVAADRPFSFSILDSDGRRIGPPHNYWLQLSAGETLQCTGCHDASDSVPHGRLDSQPVSSNPGSRGLGNGATGFPGTNSDQLFATEAGQSMAEVWDFHRPLNNATAAARELSLSQQYSDEWHAFDRTADASISDRDYDPEWTDIPADRPIVVRNLDPTLASRIVINYIDHIQPIWERVRAPLDDGTGILVDSCTGCHSSATENLVPAGQLDLTAAASDIDANHYRSYRELLSSDNQQWLDNGNILVDRQRICTELDDEGNTLTTTLTVPVGASMRAGSARGSNEFFNCFEGGSCGPGSAPPLPDNCTEDGGTVVPITANTIVHQGMLSASEMRLLSEWLDIGAQYFNNPFDPRLIE
jgi:hypothetical protein